MPVEGLERMTTGSVAKRLTYRATQVDKLKLHKQFALTHFIIALHMAD